MTVRVLYVGRVDDMKSVDNLLEAAAKVDIPDADPGFEVDIVGDNILGYGKSLDEYKADAERLEIDDRVTFHGWVDYYDLPPFYERGDLFVHPAMWPEPFGRTIIEAMSHDLPIVCTDVGAPPWISRSCGVMYPKHNPNALARRLEDLIEDDEYREQLAANASAELERFDADRVTDRIEGLYGEVLADA